MFSVSPEVYSALSLGSRWVFVFFAFLLMFFAFSWIHAERSERKKLEKNLPGTGTVGELLVLSGNEEMPPDTWFPVPREGVLGSVRSCDLVVPCEGVKPQHLDFVWQDGAGLLIRPRSGCQVLINGIPLNRSDNSLSVPMIHGSCLQVGSAVLKLQLFAALDHTNRVITPPSQQNLSLSAVDPFTPPPPTPIPFQPVQFTPEAGEPVPAVNSPDQIPVSLPPSDSVFASPAGQTQQKPPRRKRADRWKEDWSE